MPTYKKASKDTHELANSILCEFDSHQPLLDRHVRVDLLFAFGDRDENDKILSDALKHHGSRALGICKKVSLKDRAKGMGDAEILLDGDWWKEASEDERKALLDHELHHIVATPDNDDLGRPKIKLRKHDFEVGWFKIIAERHGPASQERQQAKLVMDMSGQYFWPELAKA